MQNIKLTIEYAGTLFHGWQVQSGEKSTVQGEIEKKLKIICKEKARLIGSGRTDTGVHALGQVANFKTTSQKSLGEIQKSLNALLSNDISIVHIKNVKESFHAQHSAKSKIYRYDILNRKAPSSIHNNLCYHFPHKLDIPKMKSASKLFIGTKDFKSFCASDQRRKNQDTVRTIKNVSITRRNDMISISIEANGFLYKMVRNIVGSLIAVGNSQITSKDLKRILDKKDRREAPKTAPAHGLYLVKVKY